MSFIVFSIIIFFISLSRQAISLGSSSEASRGGGEKTVASYIWKLGNISLHAVPRTRCRGCCFTAGFQHIDFVIFFSWRKNILHILYTVGAGYPTFDLVPDDLRWNWCNYNKVHNKCNHPPPQSMAKLSSMKPGPRAKKARTTAGESFTGILASAPKLSKPITSLGCCQMSPGRHSCPWLNTFLQEVSQNPFCAKGRNEFSLRSD